MTNIADLESSIKSLIVDSLIAKSSKTITPELISEITAELVIRITELFNNKGEKSCI